MGLENLKSIFTDGFNGIPHIDNKDKSGKSAFENMSESEYAKFQSENMGAIKGPVDSFSNENAQGFTNDLSTLTQTQFSGITDNVYEPTSDYRIGGIRGTGFVDFFGGSNSYNININPPIEGFEGFNLFNLGGYGFPEGHLGSSKYLDVINTDAGMTPMLGAIANSILNQTMYNPSNDINEDGTVNILDILALSNTNQNLGYGEYSSEAIYGEFIDDMRFNVGFGWPFANSILQVQQSGNSFSLFYTSTNGQISVGASGAISNFGPLDDVADFLGFDIPVFDFDQQIFSSQLQRYTDTVYEMQSEVGTSWTLENIQSAMNLRGNIFQVQSPNYDYSSANLGYFISGVTPMSHGSRVISNWLDAVTGQVVSGTPEEISTATGFTGIGDLPEVPTLETGINSQTAWGSQWVDSNKLGAKGVLNRQVTNLGPGPHWYLPGDDGFKGSFVSLGDRVYVDYLDALNNGDLDYISNVVESALGSLFSGGMSALQNGLGTATGWLGTQANTIGGWVQTGAQWIWNTLDEHDDWLDHTPLKGLEMMISDMADIGFAPIIGPLAMPFQMLFGKSNDDVSNDVGGVVGDLLSQWADTIGNWAEDVATDISGYWSDAFDDYGGMSEAIDIFNNDSIFGNYGDSYDHLIPETSFIPRNFKANEDLTQMMNLIQTYPSTQGILAALQSQGRIVSANSIFTLRGGSSLGGGSIGMEQMVYMALHSKSPIQPNPRTIIRPAGTNQVGQTPYSSLGDNPYSNNITTKHPSSNDPLAPATTTSADYYPQTLGLGESVVQGGAGGLGDLKNLAPVLAGNTLTEAGLTGETVENYATLAEGEKYGMPFYFKDLRDNKYIIFRAYLEDVNQELQPEWTEHTYLGRSEPAYVYSRTRRILNFAFKVHANTEDELQLIYEKLNYLTSLTYPRYHQDNAARMRMMPPIMSLRIGDLFGNANRNLGGFLEALSYNWEQNVSWETKEGKRVPKTCTINCSFKVIHRTPPDVDTAKSEFFGYNNSVKSFPVPS